MYGGIHVVNHYYWFIMRYNSNKGQNVDNVTLKKSSFIGHELPAYVPGHAATSPKGDRANAEAKEDQEAV